MTENNSDATYFAITVTGSGNDAEKEARQLQLALRELPAEPMLFPTTHHATGLTQILVGLAVAANLAGILSLVLAYYRGRRESKSTISVRLTIEHSLIRHGDEYEIVKLSRQLSVEALGAESLPEAEAIVRALLNSPEPVERRPQ